MVEEGPKVVDDPRAMSLAVAGVELYPAQEEAMVEIFAGNHVVSWTKKRQVIL